MLSLPVALLLLLIRSRALMCHLRDTDDLRTELTGILTPRELDALLASTHRPNYCMQVRAWLILRGAAAHLFLFCLETCRAGVLCVHNLPCRLRCHAMAAPGTPLSCLPLAQKCDRRGTRPPAIAAGVGRHSAGGSASWVVR